MHYLDAVVYTDVPQMLSAALTCRAWAGYGSPSIASTSDLTVEDIGRRIPNTAVAFTSADSTKGRHTSRWVATDGGTYRGNGTLRTDTTDLRQGYPGQQNGDQHGIALFTGGAVSGETGVTIASALSGATIESVRVYLYANHWYKGSGGTALISVHGYTSMTSAVPPATFAQKVKASGWARNSGRWVDLTGHFNNDGRGIWVGKTGTSDLEYYGWFNGPNAATQKPILEITYRR